MTEAAHRLPRRSEVPAAAAGPAGVGGVLRGLRQLDPRAAAAQHPEHVPRQRGGARRHPHPDRARAVRRVLRDAPVATGSGAGRCCCGRSSATRSSPPLTAFSWDIWSFAVLPVRLPRVPRRRVRRRRDDDRRGVPGRATRPRARHAAHLRRARHDRRRACCSASGCRRPGSAGGRSTSSASSRCCC